MMRGLLALSLGQWSTYWRFCKLSRYNTISKRSYHIEKNTPLSSIAPYN